MKTNQLQLLRCWLTLGLLAGAFGSLCSADVVYRDDFQRVGPLNGSAPTVDNTGSAATWTASAGYQCTGTNGLVNNNVGDWQGGAHLALDWASAYPDPRVQVDAKVTGNWLGLVLGDCSYWGSGATAMLKLYKNGDVDICEGPGWDGGFVKSHLTAVANADDWNRIRIDYSNSLGTATFYVNGAIVAANLPASSITTGVGFNSDNGSDTFFTNFLVSVGSDVINPPAITAQPVGLPYFVGDLARLSVDVSGTLPLYFQWRKDGVDIPGATSRLYTIAAAALTDSADYSVVVTNAAPANNVVASQVARIDVYTEHQLPMAQVNFDDLTNTAFTFGFAYSSDPTLTLPITWTNEATIGVGGSGGFVISADGSPFADASVTYSGFGGGFGLLCLPLPSTNLNFYQAFFSARIENLSGSFTNAPCRAALRFFAPDGTIGETNAGRDLIFSVERSYTFTSNYQAFAFVLNSGDFGGPTGLGQLARYQTNINAVQFEFTADNYYSQFVNGPGCNIVIDDARLMLRESPLSISGGTQPRLRWVPQVQLLMATNVAGPYEPVVGAASPFAVPAGNSAAFFRTTAAP